MAGIRFVMEGPNADLSQKKKRARLITACDACRTKKIKCVQPNLNIECEACRRSQTACLFGDRDRYHTERGISTVPHAGSLSLANAAASTSRFIAEYGADGPIPGYRFIHEQNQTGQGFEGSFSVDTVNFNAPNGLQSRRAVESTSALKSHLFEKDDSQRPRADLMMHLVDLFFNHLWIQFPFMDRNTVTSQLQAGTLSLIVQNAIAALAARYSQHPDVFSCDQPLHIAGEPYLHMAKLLAVYRSQQASVEALHAILLIAWAEYGNTRPDGMVMYTQMAVGVALELGLDKPRTAQLPESAELREMYRLTWFCVQRLDLTSSWTIGTPASLSKIQNMELIPLSLKEQSGISKQTYIFACLMEIFAIHDAISSIMNDKSQEAILSSPAEAMTALQQRLAAFVQHLPQELTFTRENFESFTSSKQGSLLILLHLMFHGTNSIAHWAGLFKEFPTAVPHNVESAYASALAIVDILLTAKSIDPTSAVADPFFEVPLAVATRVLMTAPATLSLSLNANPEIFKDSRLGWSTCMDVLGELSQYWVSTHIVAAQPDTPTALAPSPTFSGEPFPLGSPFVDTVDPAALASSWDAIMSPSSVPGLVDSPSSGPGGSPYSSSPATPLLPNEIMDAYSNEASTTYDLSLALPPLPEDQAQAAFDSMVNFNGADEMSFSANSSYTSWESSVFTDTAKSGFSADLDSMLIEGDASDMFMDTQLRNALFMPQTTSW